MIHLLKKICDYSKDIGTAENHNPMKRSIPLLLFALLLSISSHAQTVTLGKRLDDGTGKFAQTFLADIESKGTRSKIDALEPLIMGVFGWKAQRMASLGSVGAIEAAHMDVCRIVIGFYSKELDPTITAIHARAKSPTIFVLLSDAEKETIRKFVVVRQFQRFGSVDDMKDGTMPQIDERSKWQYFVAAALGETAADITMWYKFPNYAPFDKSISERLASIDTQLGEAPVGIPQSFITEARALTAFKRKQSYTVAERDQIAAQLAKTLLAGLAFETAGSGFPKPKGAASAPKPTVVGTLPPIPIYTRPTPRPTPKTSSTPDPGPLTIQKISPPKTLTSILAESRADAVRILEEGKKLSVAGSHREALAKFNTAAGLDPDNGQIFFYRSLTNFNLQLIDSAINDATSSIRLKTLLPLSYYNRGSFYLEQKNYAKAKADLDQSILFEAKDYRAFYNRGLVNKNLANTDAAYDDFSKAILLNPKHINAFLMRAQILCQKKLLMSAIHDQEAAIKLGANVPQKGCAVN